jgi:3-hydroxy-3-methylglutaryl CoA synthase
MFKKLFVLGLVSLSIAGCAMMQKSSSANASVSYTEHIEPIMRAKCTPCHYPDKGKVDMLDTYTAVRKHINDILYRIQLAPTDFDYMPYNQKKPAVTEAEIALFQQWKAEGFVE